MTAPATRYVLAHLLGRALAVRPYTEAAEIAALVVNLLPEKTQ